MAAACTEFISGRENIMENDDIYLEQLHLLVFAQNVLRGLPPVGCVFPPMLNEA